MKHFIIYILLTIIVSPLLKAQGNLVPNPSFETDTMCPNASSEIYVAPPWTGPTTNSTDYYNVCSSVRGIPVNGRYPHNGNAMVGMWMGFNGTDYREYLQAPLTSTLTAGKCYYIEFYTNLANYLDVGVNNIGANISNITYPTYLSFPGQVLNLTYHALKFGNPVITDTLNWIRITGVYKAIGGECNIIIGNFLDDAHTDSIGVQPGTNRAGYYYIDDVNVISTDSMSLPPFAGNDTTIISGDSTFIGRQLYGLHCNWYCNNALIDTNISGIWVKPTVTTKYVVEQNLCGNTGYDTVTVNVGTLGIKKYANNNGISIYPNPANNRVFVEQSKNEETTNVILFDVYGKKVFETNKQSEIDISSLTNGVYFIRVSTKNNISTQKIIIQH